jgi:hypothetical protein
MPLLSRFVLPTVTKRWGLCINPRNLTVFPQITPFFIDAPVLVVPRRSSPTRAQRRLPTPASSVAHLCPRHGGPPRRGGPPRHAAPAVPPLLGGDPGLLSSEATARRPSSSSAASYSWYAAPPPPPLVGPPLRPRSACVCPMAGQGAGGFALLTSAREMLALASIYNFI